MNEIFWGNCVGVAYSQIKYEEDGHYDPDEVLSRFHEVDFKQAELVVGLERSGSVGHVIAWSLESPNEITHRENAGMSIESGVSFYDAIGYGVERGCTLIFMKRNEEKYS